MTEIKKTETKHSEKTGPKKNVVKKGSNGAATTARGNTGPKKNVKKM